MIVTIIVVNRRGRERNETQEQEIHNVIAHHPLTNVQPADFSSSWILPPVYLLSMAFYDMECPFGQFDHLS